MENNFEENKQSINDLVENRLETALSKIAKTEEAPEATLESDGETIEKQEADWESVMILVENATGQADFEKEVVDKLKKIGLVNVYASTNAASGLSDKYTSIAYCPDCSNVAVEVLSVLQNPDLVSSRADKGLLGEIRIRLGSDQVMKKNEE